MQMPTRGGHPVTGTPWHMRPSLARLTSAFRLTLVLLTLDASPSAFQSRDAAVVPPGTALVQGRVVTDDATARPVRRAMVTISGAAPSYSRMTATDDEVDFYLPICLRETSR